MASVDMESMAIAVDSENIPDNEQMNCDPAYSDELDMANYKIQLMDQFSVTTDQVEFSQNDDGQLNTSDNQSNFDIYDIEDINKKSNDIVLSYLCAEDMLFEDLPFEVMETPDKPTSSKESPIKSEEETRTEYERMCQNLDGTQFESYQNWLDSVIETMNLVLDFNNDGHPDPLKFCVPHVRDSIVIYFSRCNFISYWFCFSCTLTFSVQNFRPERKRSACQILPQSLLKENTRISHYLPGYFPI